MLRLFALSLLTISGLSALDEGELRFSLGGKIFSTKSAKAFVRTRNGKAHIYIAVRDAEAKFMLMLSAEVEKGNETKVLQLNSADSSVSFILKSLQGTMAIIPHQQLAPVTDLQYTTRTLTETSEVETEVDQTGQEKFDDKRKKKKIRAAYHKAKPRWHAMNRSERLRTGEGVIENGMFKDTYLSLNIVPEISGGKIVGLSGSFAGNGRFSKSYSGSEIKNIQTGSFRVKVENAP